MITVQNDNKQKIIEFLPTIKKNLNEWIFITIHVANIHISQPSSIQKQLLNFFENKEGFSFISSDNRILLALKLDKFQSFTALKQDIKTEIGNHRYHIIIQKMNSPCVNQIHEELTNSRNVASKTLFHSREERKENVILLAEDDEFIRKTLIKLLSKNAEILEVEDGKDVMEAYKKHNPDIMILDIHLPNKNGLNLMEEVFEEDYDAFIIVSSSDSVKENVLESISNGAVGFLAKPIQKDRLNDFLQQCITYRKEAA